MSLLLRFWRKALHRPTPGGAGSVHVIPGRAEHGDQPQATELPEEYRRGLEYVRSRQYAKARELIERVVAREPGFIDGLNALANLARLDGQYAEAERLYRNALELQSTNPALWSNLGLCLREAGRIDEAIAALRHALTLAPASAHAYANLAVAVTDKAGFSEARELLQRSLEIDPNLAEAHTALAHLLLQDGDFSAGWREYAWRFRCADADECREYPIAVWDGQTIRDRVLLVRAEQGLGDQLMFASCLPEAISAARLCLVECDRRLVNLFARSFPSAQIFAAHLNRETEWHRTEPVPDFQVHLGALPGLFRKRTQDFPRHHGYLRADPDRVTHWRNRLAELGSKLKVGISWRGGAPRTRTASRSIPLSQWLPILSQENVDFVSLQYGRCEDEVAEFNKRQHVRLHCWQEAIQDYDETAALVSALDLIISVQTALIHLAGASGKRVWVLVPAVPEWRYLATGTTMPWYPTVSLHRQQAQGDWGPVIAQTAAALALETVSIAATKPTPQKAPGE